MKRKMKMKKLALGALCLLLGAGSAAMAALDPVQERYPYEIVGRTNWRSRSTA